MRDSCPASRKPAHRQPYRRATRRGSLAVGSTLGSLSKRSRTRSSPTPSLARRIAMHPVQSSTRSTGRPTRTVQKAERLPADAKPSQRRPIPALRAKRRVTPEPNAVRVKKIARRADRLRRLHADNSQIGLVGVDVEALRVASASVRMPQICKARRQDAHTPTRPKGSPANSTRVDIDGLARLPPGK